MIPTRTVSLYTRAAVAGTCVAWTLIYTLLAYPLLTFSPDFASLIAASLYILLAGTAAYSAIWAWSR